MNLVSIVPPQNDNNFPETFKYVNSDKSISVPDLVSCFYHKVHDCPLKWHLSAGLLL